MTALRGERKLMQDTSIDVPRKEKKRSLICRESSKNLSGSSTIDEKLLSKAVSELNAIYVSKGIETARSIGTYVINTFFEGDIDLFRKKNKKHPTFRALASRDDLAFAFNTIWYSVAVLEQFRHLPKNIAESLSLAHHKLLLPVEDIETKKRLAQRAVIEKMSSREFAETIREEFVGTKRKKCAEEPRLFRAYVMKLKHCRKHVDFFISLDTVGRKSEMPAINGKEELIGEIVALNDSLLKLKEHLTRVSLC